MAIIPCPLEKNAATFPQHPAIITQEKTYTHKQCSTIVASIEQLILDNQVSAQTRIAIYLPSSPEYLLLLVACWRLDIIPVLLSTRRPISYATRQAQARNCSFIITEKTTNSVLPTIHLPEVFKSDSQNKVQPSWNLENIGTILYTSGSTSEPKAAVHTLANHYYSAQGSATNIPLNQNSRWSLSLPLYHVGGLAVFFRTLLAGATCVMGVNSLTSSNKYKITHISLVAAQLQKFITDASTLTSLKEMSAILLGGSAIPKNLIHEACNHKLSIYLSYGSTEMSSQIATTYPNAPQEVLLQAKAKVLPHRELKISSTGEILVRGQTLFLGYEKSNGKLELPINKQGWFHTGDLGILDEQGYLQVIGRIDNMFISGGENIQPEEIESLLCRCQNVEQAVVVPLPHKKFGHRPIAFLKTTEPISHEKIILELKKQLEPFKIPDTFLPWPKNAEEGMKISRKIFQQEAQKLIQPN